MQTKTEQRIVTGHTGASQAFHIKANGKAFRVLIDGLYGDKITSITRELWSNALDSHAMKGCPERPFKVSLPSLFDSTFRVRDYGISLTHDEVMNLYTTVFESTKETTNTQVGQLGLGSKSPFSYTDSFSLTVILAGERRFYSAMISAEGIPTIHLMGHERTHEEDGVEVSFPVDRKDVPAFQKASQMVGRGFDVKPEISNAHSIPGWMEDKPVMAGNGFKIYPKGPNQFVAGCQAKMGCVIYPIDFAQIEGLNETAKWLSSKNALIEFPLGSLEFTSSRESLSYGRYDPTAKSVSDRLNQIGTAIGAELEEQFHACATRWEVRQYLWNLQERSDNPPSVIKMVKQLKWRNQKVSAVEWFGQSPGDGLKINVFDLRRRKTGLAWSNAVTPIAIEAQPKTAFYIEDCSGEKTKSVPARIRAHIAAMPEDTRAETIYWIRWNGSLNDVPKFMDFIDRYEGAPIVHVADLPKPGANGTRNPRKKVSLRCLKTSSFEQEWDTDVPENGYWVKLEHGVAQGISKSNILQCMISLVDLKFFPNVDSLKDLEVLGVPRSRWPEFQDRPGWTLTLPAAEDFCLRQQKAHSEIIQKGVQRRHISQSLPMHTLVRDLELHRLIVADSPMKRVIHHVETTKNSASDDDTCRLVRKLAEALHMTSEPDCDPFLENLVTLCNKRYPLLQMITNRYRHDHCGKVLADYINTVDLAEYIRPSFKSRQPD